MNKVKIQNITFQKSFIVFPQDTNYMYPMVFGGKVLAEMDIAAATAVRRACNHSPTAKHAVTTVVGPVEFFIGAEVGDLIMINTEISKLGNSSIYIDVVCVREDKFGETEMICKGQFVFVTVEFLKQLSDKKKHVPVPHLLEF